MHVILVNISQGDILLRVKTPTKRTLNPPPPPPALAIAHVDESSRVEVVNPVNDHSDAVESAPGGSYRIAAGGSGWAGYQG